MCGINEERKGLERKYRYNLTKKKHQMLLRNRSVFYMHRQQKKGVLDDCRELRLLCTIYTGDSGGRWAGERQHLGGCWAETYRKGSLRGWRLVGD